MIHGEAFVKKAVYGMFCLIFNQARLIMAITPQRAEAGSSRDFRSSKKERNQGEIP